MRTVHAGVDDVTFKDMAYLEQLRLLRVNSRPLCAYEHQPHQEAEQFCAREIRFLY